jgi:hypothetical protein
MSAYINNNKMHGVVNGLFLCNLGRTEELNDRIYTRNIPSQGLQPQFSQVPVSTKYSIMPILDQRAKPIIPLNNYPIYDSEKIFNPGNAQAPWSGFSNNINVESNLRNQFFANQRCEQSYYVPSSNSDLYNVTVDSGPDVQTHPLLFKQEMFDYFNPNCHNLGNNQFIYNNTRDETNDVSVTGIRH